MSSIANGTFDCGKTLNDDGELDDIESNANNEKRNSMHDNPGNVAVGSRHAKDFDNNVMPK